MSSKSTASHTWKPIVAGVLDIMAGIAMIVGAFLFVLLLLSGTFYLGSPDDPSTMTRFWLATISLLIPGVLALIGGGAALNRRQYVMAVIGSACAILVLFGIASLILVIGSRDEFRRSSKPAR